MTVSDPTIANEIKRQLGGGTLYMLGAKNLTYDNISLTFKVSGSKRVSHVRIALNGSDLYDMTFFKIGKVKGVSTIKTVSEKNDVYFDGLHKMIEQETGLYTKL